VSHDLSKLFEVYFFSELCCDGSMITLKKHSKVSLESFSHCHKLIYIILTFMLDSEIIKDFQKQHFQTLACSIYIRGLMKTKISRRVRTDSFGNLSRVPRISKVLDIFIRFLARIPQEFYIVEILLDGDGDHLCECF